MLPCLAGYLLDVCRHSLPEGWGAFLPCPQACTCMAALYRGLSRLRLRRQTGQTLIKTLSSASCSHLAVPHEGALHMLQVMNGVAPADMPQAEEFLSNIDLSLRKSLIAIDLK